MAGLGHQSLDGVHPNEKYDWRHSAVVSYKVHAVLCDAYLLNVHGSADACARASVKFNRRIYLHTALRRKVQ